MIGSAIPRIGSSNALGYDTSTRRRLSRLDHLVKRFPHLLTGYRHCDFRPLLCLVWPVSYPLTLPKGGLYSSSTVLAEAQGQTSWKSMVGLWKSQKRSATSMA